MKLPARSALWLLPLLLSGCVEHKTQQAQVEPLAPPIVDAPPPKTTVPTDLPPPVVNAPQTAPAAPAPEPREQPEPTPVHKKPAPAKPVEQASNDTSGVSAIGQLSTGDPADIRLQTVNSINATERALREIGRKLSEQEQKTAIQIREFVKQAREALTSGDVDGANTLAAKAKVLLQELTR